MKKMTDTFKLNNGYEIPCVGFGTWQTPDGDTAIKAVSEAIRAGYCHIDTAACYGNETSVGKGIKVSGVERSRLFVTGKVWNSDRGYGKTMVAFEKTMADLELDYLDLYLIHWPASSTQFEDWEQINLETWRAMTELYKAGRIKAIGVCNFLPHHLKALMETEVQPMVNQIEMHPYFAQESALKVMEEYQIVPEAWAPLGGGRHNPFDNEMVKEIAAAHGKTVGQVVLRWNVQRGVVVIPKSVHKARIEENFQIWDFTLTEEEMQKISSLDLGYQGTAVKHFDPEFVKMCNIRKIHE